MDEKTGTAHTQDQAGVGTRRAALCGPIARPLQQLLAQDAWGAAHLGNIRMVLQQLLEIAAEREEFQPVGTDQRLEVGAGQHPRRITAPLQAKRQRNDRAHVPMRAKGGDHHRALA